MMCDNADVEHPGFPCAHPGLDEREGLARLLDEADNRWQHGIGSGGYDPDGPPLWLVDAIQPWLIWYKATAQVEALAPVLALADEWEQEAGEDERWLNGPHVAVSEAREYPALIRQARSHAASIRALAAVESGEFFPPVWGSADNA